MSKKGKIVADVLIVLKSVSIRRQLDSGFIITCRNGKTTVESKYVRPDSKGELYFNCECKARRTFTVSKSNGVVKQKNIIIVLHRYTPDNTPKIYGKLVLDIGKRINSKETDFTIGMSTNRSIPPFLNLSCQFDIISKPQDVVPSEPVVPETTPEQVNQTNSEEESNSYADLIEYSDEEVDNSGGDDRAQSPKGDSSNINTKNTSNTETKRRRKVSRARKTSEASPTTAVEDESQSPNSEEKEKEKEKIVPMKQETKEQRFARIMALMPKLLMQRFSQSSNPSYLDSDRKLELPPAVFPIYGLILESGILLKETDKNEYKQFADLFFDKYKNAPLSMKTDNESKLLTHITLYLLIQLNPRKEKNSKSYTKDFLKRLENIINIQTREIVFPMLTNFEILSNRFIQAKFEVDSLLADFQEVFDIVRASLGFTSSINSFMFDVFVSLLDVKLSNRVLSNPNRLTFSNVILWHSFATAFEQCVEKKLNYLKQITGLILMIPNLSPKSKNDEILQSVCPSLKKGTVAYILMNTKKDEIMQDDIPFKQLAKKLNVMFIPGFEKLELVENQVLEIPPTELKLNMWNRTTTLDVLREFQFLRKYLPQRRTASAPNAKNQQKK
ncbi:hypothetical protein GPJ56_006053 [Histomonas meleagridis]|uniref:uncharacterized protein n=1 Tax=Histomonas meleagridis TaxID=135588 RepID=UPI0035597F2C|nr:hypothetical protein GPJ56_006053 [Histomonas meleagridis]KAH0807161.1 hypothetical protein GO595_000337 [Histomonas meleagridis]